MNTQSRSEFVNRIVERKNGNPNGIKAIIAGLGRMAAANQTCIFDCPYEAGSDDAEIWMDAYVEEDKKIRLQILAN